MKGLSYDGSHFANKGTSRSEGTEMFSVGNLVAFSYHHYCSPDARSHSSGCVPNANGYLLQEDIVLEEFDNTTSDRYGSGNYDVKKIVELLDVFWHEYSTQLQYKTFLLQILETSENVFNTPFFNREITEVRNHPGKFLHIYEIPEKYRGFRAENFSHTLEAINLQIKKEEELANEAIVKNYRGVELIFGITASGWYASRASFGEHSVQRAHEHDSTRRHHYKIVIMPCASNGNYQFYIGDGFPISLCLQDGQYPSIDTCTITHWANSQSWKYVEIETLDIQKGWIFVDGQDVYECTKRTIEENNARKLTERQQKFVAAKTAALEAGFTEAQIEGVVKTAPKGEKILFLKGGISLVKEGFSTFEVVDLLQDIKASNISVIQNYARLQKFAKQISVTQVQKVLDKAYAWSYLMNLLPQVTFTGYFDDAMDALRMGVERGIFPKSSFLLSRTYSKDQSLAVSSVIDGNRTSTYTLGEIESLQQLKKQLGE